MKKQKKIYLHIGTQKTGTSTIQSFLNHNHEKLEKLNYTAFVPETDTYPDNSLQLRNIIELIIKTAREGGSHWDKHQRQSLLNSIKPVKEATTDNIILSDELFWNTLRTSNQRTLFFGFTDMLQEFSELSVIVYLRRQDWFLMSLYQQRLRGGNMNGMRCHEWIAPIIRSSRTISNYELYIKHLLSHFNKSNIIVRPFETTQFDEQSLLSDFLNSVGLKKSGELETPVTRRNPGLSPILAEIIRCLSVYHRTRDTIIPFLENRKNTQLFNQKWQHDFLSPQERIKILNRYQSGNQWIAREFLGRGDGKLFQEPLPDIHMPWKPYKLEPEEVRTFFSNADFLEENQRAVLQEQVLHVLSHPGMVKTRLFQRKIRQTIRNKLEKYRIASIKHRH